MIGQAPNTWANLGIDLDWDYIGQKVHTSMLRYAEAALAFFDLPPNGHNSSHTPTSSSHMGKRYNTPNGKTTPPSS